MTLAEYLQALDERVSNEPGQQNWYADLSARLERGEGLLDSASELERAKVDAVFRDWVRTEEIKAWYGEPEGDSLFQGTSVTSLTIPAVYEDPLPLSGIEDLENALAQEYIARHDALESTLEKAILEDTAKWRHEGLFYGLAIGSKMLSQAFGLTIGADDAVFEVDGVMVDPHEITTYPAAIRQAYFERCLERITCFQGLDDLTRRELECSLVLADISKPKIDDYWEKILLAPVRCNEIAAVMARRVKDKIIEMTEGRITPRSLMVTIFDTDTPYTYHQIMGYFGQDKSPVLPGLTVLGCSGTMDAFRWLYAYRVSLVAQKIMKSSIWSETARCFIPFVFFGVLVERDADILLDLDHLDRLRYRGNLSPYLEYTCLAPIFREYLEATAPAPFDDDRKRIR